MDYATAIGLLSSIVLITLAIAVGGHLPAFVDLPSVLIVIGGTLTVTLTSFTFTDVVRTLAISASALTHQQPTFSALARHLLQFAQKTRQAGGLLALQKDVAAEPNAFLRQALSLAVDGAPAETIEKLLYQDTVSYMERHERALAVLRRAADVAPAMGLIGTLIGLVQMLGQLSDPTAIGPAMAVAILTTFYGAILSYVVLTPLATKLERTGADDLLTRKLITTAVLSYLKQENPRQLQLHLNAQLPPALRVSVFR
ncbi:MAG: flagellar motor protein MotA [Proteobacteria bacterium]|nr:flagellar motor protein MotA [Pseudomonadota bacterium]